MVLYPNWIQPALVILAPEEDVDPLNLALLHYERLAARVHALIGANLGRNSICSFDIQE